MKILHIAILSTCICLASFKANAESYDIIGGPEASAQTIHHCGYLPTTQRRYTTSGTTVRVVEKKLHALGYTKTSGDGTYGKIDKHAIRHFQRDAGIQVDGIVGPITAKHLAFSSHPSANVKRCGRQAIALR